jgi:hypothetical protein
MQHNCIASYQFEKGALHSQEALAPYAFSWTLPVRRQLKSVANLPWRVFMYRACNTFIDDLFAFIIKMPALHRLSALRDDVVFLVYLFQRCPPLHPKTVVCSGSPESSGME